MICPYCKTRYADFPKQDWELKGGSILPKNKRAEERRLKVFYSDEQVVCEDCKEIQDAEIHHQQVMQQFPVCQPV